MNNYKGLFTFDVDNHRYVPVEQADGLISDMNYYPELEEEPKEYWFIENDGEINSIGVDEDYAESLRASKEIGNYFETKEEAEKAVEKLKTLTRLCRKGLEFNGVEMFGSGLIRIEASIPINEKTTLQERSDITDNLYLLFGGEE